MVVRGNNLAFKGKKTFAGILDILKIPNSFFLVNNPRVILGYHRILPKERAIKEFIQNCMWVSPQTFENHIIWMKRIGSIVPVEELIDFRANNKKPLFSLTFDDGWRDFYEYAYPILRKYNLSSKVFLITRCIMENRMPWPDEVYSKSGKAIGNGNVGKILKFLSYYLGGKSRTWKQSDLGYLLDEFLEHMKLMREEIRMDLIEDYYKYIGVNSKPIEGAMLTWKQIKEMSLHNVSFGSHTHNHLILQGASAEKIWFEITQSKELIESHIGCECNWFCYPNARYNRYDHELLQKAGYQYAVTLNCSILKESFQTYYLPRFIVYEDISNPLGYLKLRIMGVPFF